MNITRHNYEEYFLLYVDNELNISQRKAVETFVEENPDLRAELIMLQQSVLPADNTLFTGKHTLLKNTTAPGPVNETNCEEYFVQYADDELTNEQKEQVEQFIYRNPQHQATFELLQQVKLMPDTAIVYPDKYALYRREEEDKTPVIRIGWRRIAAAAVVLLFAGAMGWFIVKNNGTDNPGRSGTGLVVNDKDSGKTTQPEKTLQQPTQEGIARKDNIPATTSDKTQEQVAAADKEKSNNKTRQQNISVPKVIVLADPAPNQNMAVNNPDDKKNNNAPDNKQIQQDVPKETLASNTLKPQQVGGVVDQTNRGIIDPAADNRNPAMAVLTAKPAETVKPAVAVEEIDPDEIFASDNDNNKKNRSRGFFRKVSRVFDKATNADPDHEKSSIRIASFEIALK